MCTYIVRGKGWDIIKKDQVAIQAMSQSRRVRNRVLAHNLHTFRFGDLIQILSESRICQLSQNLRTESHNQTPNNEHINKKNIHFTIANITGILFIL